MCGKFSGKLVRAIYENEYLDKIEVRNGKFFSFFVVFDAINGGCKNFFDSRQAKLTVRTHCDFYYALYMAGDMFAKRKKNSKSSLPELFDVR